MANDETGAAGGSTAAAASMISVPMGAAGAALVRIDFYPEEVLDGTVARGHFYVHVRGALTAEFEACGGPPPGEEHSDRGGHFAAQTTPGGYVLGPSEHYVTDSWPSSTVPWGASLRATDDNEIEYSSDGGISWSLATGPNGRLTKSWIAFEERTRAGVANQENAAHAGEAGYVPVQPAPLSDGEIEAIGQQSRLLFYVDGVLPALYLKNDFGKWAWNLEQVTSSGVARTGMFVHTTPTDEQSTALEQPFQLSDSHGCIHIRPADRDQMMGHGYLQRGVHLVVKPYGAKGP